LGGEAGTSTRGFHGALDDVRFSAEALPNAQLLFNNEGPTAATVGFWRFESKLGLLKDNAGHGHDLSVGPGRRASANAQPTAPTDPAFAALCHALLNSSEFFYLE
jgi:hypothetical protein